MDILRTHSFVLIGEVLHRNAFFVSPEELQRELRGNGAITAARLPFEQVVTDAFLSG
jgi:hypothetical protein